MEEKHNRDLECDICGIEVIPDNPGCSTINGWWVHNSCVSDCEENLQVQLNKPRKE